MCNFLANFFKYFAAKSLTYLNSFVLNIVITITTFVVITATIALNINVTTPFPKHWN